MPKLNTKPGSSTKKQHQTLVLAGKRKGFDLAEIRKTVGGSLRKLSAAECSKWIKHFSGADLPNPPGEKRSAYAGRKRSDAVRMITTDQVEQIERLLGEYFGAAGGDASYAWLAKNFSVGPLVGRSYAVIPAGAAKRRSFIFKLGTAKRAGQVIAVLKSMLRRRELKSAQARSPARG